uniref:SAM and SH3 domain-containing protein 3 n=1 Tax=Doryrhamphus excisus TaxID=161450 RepID=UPI0025AE4B7F|nr:SAM and SH3 domain-containing protein 3 [Doryrhamphus excisus]
MLRRRPSNASEKEQVQKKKLTLQRSSSFKDFMKPKVTSPVSSEKDLVLDETVEDGGIPDGSKSGTKLGKKWRNVISRTMTRKTSKMVQKVLAEEGPFQGESSEEMSPVSPSWPPAGVNPGQRTSMCSTGSEDTVSSPVICPFSSNSDRQSLDSGYCQRDSMRLEDNAYNGPFCGRALVHTDFTPSPYDVDSLKLQKGDIIHIIEKPPVGTWTGKLNNKVGSFKFIYINLLPDESPPVRRRRCDKTSTSKSKPATLEEVLDSIGLAELTSLLSMHGFQNLEDFTGLQESHLNELNITDPDQRAKILSATDLLREYEEEQEREEKEEDEDSSMVDTQEPRDSGCFESSEHLEETKPEEELQDEETETNKETGEELQDEKTETNKETGEELQDEKAENNEDALDDLQQHLQELSVHDGC